MIEFDIKGFFDNVNRSKLIRQIWAMGIRQTVDFIYQADSKAPIRMPDGTTLSQTKAPARRYHFTVATNIVLNELDKWVETMAEPPVKEYGL